MSNTSFDVFGCSLDGRNLVEASAGTGKTWNICWLYLRQLLERRLKVENILVVTFTNAATAELRERIRARANETLAHLKGEATADPHVASLIGALQGKGLALEEIQARLDEALQSFDQAAIFTIHSFCQRAMGISAFSAGQAFSLDLLPDESDMLKEAVYDFWRHHVAAGDITREQAAWLVRQNFNPDALLPLLKRVLEKPLAKIVWPEDVDASAPVDQDQLRHCFAAARDLWRLERDGIIDKIRQAAQAKHLHNGTYKDNKITIGAEDLDRYFHGDDVMADIGKDAFLFSAGMQFIKKSSKGTLPSHPFFNLLDELFSIRQQAERELELMRIGLLKRLTEQAEAVRQRKRERRVLSYDDILYNLYAALTGGENPWLAPALRRQYPAALIDEFQDTDALQYLIFDTIYSDPGNESGSHSVFFVGDPKQAIYSFRNADLNVYFKAQERIRARHTLQQNQRSSKGLIDALNALFQSNRCAFVQEGLDYVPVSFGEKPRKPFNAPAESDASLRIWTLPQNEQGEPLSRTEAMLASSEATADEIARLLNAAARNEIAIGEQPLSAGDIAVLVRSRRQGHLIRQALHARGIGSVELSQQSVFHSSDAEDMERVLSSILSPARENQLRAALATEMIGLDVTAITALRDDPEQLARWIDRFAHYRTIWFDHGIGSMLQHLFSQERISARMLLRPDGERRLTNLHHLAELLHQTAEMQDSPDALLRWLAARRRDESAGEEAQLRLESDRRLVKIVTIHKSKGLEYEVVFCPFLWDGYQRARSQLQGAEYRDTEGNLVIDMRSLCGELPEDIGKRIRTEAQREESAESLRLVYVALTRAVQRCYLIAGCYSRKTATRWSTTESARSLLNWLVAGDGMEFEEWRSHKLQPANIDVAWQAVKGRCPAAIELVPLPSSKTTPAMLLDEVPVLLPTAKPPHYIPQGWRIGSFSNLMRGAKSENAANDHDVHLPAPERPAEPAEPLPQDDILLFPRGPEAGNCMHAAFELCNFADPSGWEQAIEKALMLHPQQTGALRSVPQDEHPKRLKAMMLHMMGDVLRTPLPNGIVLNDIGNSRRLTEMEFFIPAPDIAPDVLHALLVSMGYQTPFLNAAKLSGYLKGFIDLVIEHGGRYYILDWKSNHLGYSAMNYGAESMSRAMAEHGYHLQYLLYTVALNRYLARRMPDYSYDTHFGGVLYLFVRGVRPEWKDEKGDPLGVFFHCPDRSDIEQLDSALRGMPADQSSSAPDKERMPAC